MFNNIGKKIKGLAKAYFIIVAALFVIMAIATMAITDIIILFFVFIAFYLTVN